MGDLVTLNNNFEGKEGSFIYYLHEKSYFDKELFDEYLKSAIELTNQYPKNNDILLKLFKVNNYIMRSFIYHLSPEDLSKIDNFPGSEIFDYVEGISIILESIIKGEEIDKELFSVDLY